MSCSDSNVDFEKYTKTTKFKQVQIKSFYNYFKKYTQDSDFLNYNQFKNSLGILGSKNNDFVCSRLFLLIDINQEKRVIITLYFR